MYISRKTEYSFSFLCAQNNYISHVALQKRIWNAYSSMSDGVWDDDVYGTEQTTGFSIKNAVLFPTEVEKGLWPEDYSLSDHARLTVVFSPVRMPRSLLLE